jgi:hypothetical protein
MIFELHIKPGIRYDKAIKVPIILSALVRVTGISGDTASLIRQAID